MIQSQHFYNELLHELVKMASAYREEGKITP